MLLYPNMAASINKVLQFKYGKKEEICLEKDAQTVFNNHQFQFHHLQINRVYKNIVPHFNESIKCQEQIIITIGRLN